MAFLAKKSIFTQFRSFEFLRPFFIVTLGTLSCFSGQSSAQIVWIPSPANNVVLNSPTNVVIQASYDSQDCSDAPTKFWSVTFYRNNVQLSTVNFPTPSCVGTISYTDPNVPAGLHSYKIIGKYKFSNNTLLRSTTPTTVAPASIINVGVSGPPTVTLTAPTNGSVIANAPGSIVMSANAADDSSGAITKVEFLNGSSIIGTVTSPPYNFSWNGLGAGTYSISARATDNSGNTANSASASVVVNSAPTVFITQPTSGASLTSPASVVLTANASDADGSVASVTYYANGTQIGGGAGTNWGFSWSNIAAASYNITAVAVDNRGVATTSAPVSLSAVIVKLVVAFTVLFKLLFGSFVFPVFAVAFRG
jgi:Bacterial Ig domain